jgi:hypothetical protein
MAVDKSSAKAFTLNEAVYETVLRDEDRLRHYNFGSAGEGALNGLLSVFTAPVSEELKLAAFADLEEDENALFNKTQGITFDEFFSRPLPPMHVQYISEAWKVYHSTLGLSASFNDNLGNIRKSKLVYGTGVETGAYSTVLSYYNDEITAFGAIDEITAFGAIYVSEGFGGGADPSRPYQDWLFESIVHETGHQLGLQHPGNYNGDSATKLIWDQDSWDESIMSYVGQAEFEESSRPNLYPITPRTLDFAALDQIYASQSDSSGRAFGLANAFIGDTHYGFNSNIDSDVSYVYSRIGDLLGGKLTNENRTGIQVGVAMTIADASGADVLDFSGYQESSKIDLHIMTGDEYRSRLSAINGIWGNLSLAIGTVIENAIGGAGDDELLDNEMDNVLAGGRGDDWFQITGGTDVVDGGAGVDTVRLTGMFDDYKLLGKEDGLVVYSRSDKARRATLSSIEYIEFENGAQRLDVADFLQGLSSVDPVTGQAGQRVRFENGQEDIYSLREEGWLSGDSDRISNFDRDDEIDLRSIDADINSDGFQQFEYVGKSDFSGEAGELRFARGNLLADLDGDAQADLSLRIKKGEGFSFGVQNLIV